MLTETKRKDKKMKTMITVKRANGKVETVDVTGKYGVMTAETAEKIRTINAKVGNEIISIVVTTPCNNYAELERKYRNGMLEGGEGYIPDLTKDPEYRQWVETKNY